MRAPAAILLATAHEHLPQEGLTAVTRRSFLGTVLALAGCSLVGGNPQAQPTSTSTVTSLPASNQVLEGLSLSVPGTLKPLPERTGTTWPHAFTRDGSTPALMLGKPLNAADLGQAAQTAWDSIAIEAPGWVPLDNQVLQESRVARVVFEWKPPSAETAPTGAAWVVLVASGGYVPVVLLGADDEEHSTIEASILAGGE